MEDYRKYYNLENYLFDNEFRRRFTNRGLKTFDFHCILIWKANRAKTKLKDRLSEKAGSYDKAVDQIFSGLLEQDSPKNRLRFLMSEWGFYLPTATAILSVLYPDEFTVYDTRVCSQLQKEGERDFAKLAARIFKEPFWAEYEAFKAAVYKCAPKDYCLRDKDRFLWGKDFYEQVDSEISGKRKS